jgi:hypothetical protein
VSRRHRSWKENPLGLVDTSGSAFAEVTCSTSNATPTPRAMPNPRKTICLEVMDEIGCGDRPIILNDDLLGTVDAKADSLLRDGFISNIGLWKWYGSVWYSGYEAGCNIPQKNISTSID